MCCSPEAYRHAAQYGTSLRRSLQPPSCVGTPISLSLSLSTYSRVLHFFMFGSSDVICIVKERMLGVDVMSVRLSASELD